MANYFPSSIEEALSIKNATYAGGLTDLMPLFRNRVRDDEDLVFLSRIPEMQVLTVKDGYIEIGAAVTLTDVAGSAEVREHLPALAQAAGAAASPQIRNIATLGGNILQDRRCIYFNQSEEWRSAIPLCFKTGGDICHQIPVSPVCRAIYYSDAATALMLYEAEADVIEEGTKKTILAGELIHLHSQANGLGCHDHLTWLLTGFRVPIPPEGERSGFCKYAMRASMDFPLINFALRRGGSRPAKITAGAVAPEPVILAETAGLLDAGASAEEILESCAKEMKGLAMPIKEACIPPSRKRDLYMQLAQLLTI